MLLWNVFDTETKTSTENKSKIKFRGRRKGAIYDICWSENGEHLCYVSDDRSVQLWKLTNSKQLTMIYRVYGHLGRTFKCWISPNADFVASISEDSTCRVWNSDGSLIDIFEFRFGAIWSLDVCYKPQQDLYHVALGGADSSIRFHYFLSPSSPKEENIISNPAFYQINTTQPDDKNKFLETTTSSKKRKRGKRRNSANNIRIILIDSVSRILFATSSHIYRCDELSAVTRNESTKWQTIAALNDMFKEREDDEITTMQLTRDLFSDYGHYENIDDSLTKVQKPKDLLSKYSISANKFRQIPEDQSDSFIKHNDPNHASQTSLNTVIKKTDNKIAANLHFEHERWLIFGTKFGHIAVIDLCSSTYRNVLSFRAHDIGILSVYSCITSFQPETTTTNNLKAKYKERLNVSSSNNKQLRFSLSASDLHKMADPQTTNQYLKMYGNSSFLLFTSDGNGNLRFWCFPLSKLQREQSDEELQEAIKSSASFMNPSKKQISAFCYLPPPKNLLIVGDSRGSIMLYSLMNLQNRSMHKPMQILKAMHGRDPVSCIKAVRGIAYIHDKDKVFHDDDDDDEDDDGDINDDKVWIVSGGKDGKIREYTFVSKAFGNDHFVTADSVRKSRSDFNLRAIGDEQTMIDGEMLMPIRPNNTSLSSVDDIFMNENDEMIVCGFKSTDFIVWNSSSDYVLFKWNCGGNKRPHCLQMLKYDQKQQQKSDDKQYTLDACRGWIFAYTNTNISNAIALFHIDFPSPIPVR